METSPYVRSHPTSLLPSLHFLSRRARSDAPPAHDSINMTLTKSKYDLFTDHTHRSTDPLSPSYFINGSSYSSIDKNKPTPQRNHISDSKLLQTDDIDGAQAGYRLHHRLSIPEELRREYRNTNYLEDIEGAHADTVKHSIRTQRLVNPLVPCYQSLDGNQEIVSGPIESLVPSHLIDQRSDFKSYGTVRGGGGGGAGGGGGSRQNILSRSGNNSFLSPSPSSSSLMPLSPSNSGRGGGESGGFYSSFADFNEMTSGGEGGGGQLSLSLSQSKSYAEKYFPRDRDMDLLKTNDTSAFHTHTTAGLTPFPILPHLPPPLTSYSLSLPPSLSSHSLYLSVSLSLLLLRALSSLTCHSFSEIHSPVKLQFGSTLTSPVDTSKTNPHRSGSGFSSPITTNRSRTSASASSAAALSSRRQKVEYDAEVDAVRRL
jgi:hypothetical protein